MDIQLTSETKNNERIDTVALKRHLGKLQNKAMTIQALLNAAQALQTLEDGHQRNCDLLELSTELATELNQGLDSVSLTTL